MKRSLRKLKTLLTFSKMKNISKNSTNHQIEYFDKSLELFCLFWFVAQVCKQICDKNQETSKKVLIFHKNSNLKNKFKNKINEKQKLHLHMANDTTC